MLSVILILNLIIFWLVFYMLLLVRDIIVDQKEKGKILFQVRQALCEHKNISEINFGRDLICTICLQQWPEKGSKGKDAKQ